MTAPESKETKAPVREYPTRLRVARDSSLVPHGRTDLTADEYWSIRELGAVAPVFGVLELDTRDHLAWPMFWGLASATEATEWALLCGNIMSVAEHIYTPGRSLLALNPNPAARAKLACRYYMAYTRQPSETLILDPANQVMPANAPTRYYHLPDTMPVAHQENRLEQLSLLFYESYVPYLRRNKCTERIAQDTQQFRYLMDRVREAAANLPAEFWNRPAQPVQFVANPIPGSAVQHYAVESEEEDDDDKESSSPSDSSDSDDSSDSSDASSSEDTDRVTDIQREEEEKAPMNEEDPIIIDVGDERASYDSESSSSSEDSSDSSDSFSEDGECSK